MTDVDPRQRKPVRHAKDWKDYARSDPGHPLGRGMPLGESMRLDGESHREAWMRLMRADPCSYCDAPESGTVDHIIARSRAPSNEAHKWHNYTGACSACNGSKRDEKMLIWLARRRIIKRG